MLIPSKQEKQDAAYLLPLASSSVRPASRDSPAGSDDSAL